VSGKRGQRVLFARAGDRTGAPVAPEDPLHGLILDSNMLVALISTKLPILLGRGFWGFRLRSLPSDAFWAMAHESRTDLAMLLGALFLLIVGGGRASRDAALARRDLGL